MPENFRLTQLNNYCKAEFRAMASPCEILIDSSDLQLALNLGLNAQTESLRVEEKYSRYRQDNIICKVNSAQGKPVEVDDETASLIDFAVQLFHLSDGKFDITSGVLRKVWHFDGSDNIPSKSSVDALLPLIGWSRTTWESPVLTLQPGMEIDLGGIGKEYAVDKVFEQLSIQCDCPLLVNFGGDIRARGPRKDGSAWKVGVEKRVEGQVEQLNITTGAMATSGDAYRFLQKDGRRYSHILDPVSGWPIENAPKAVTVVAPTCVQAGVFSSLALMMGAEAEKFLDEQVVPYWSVR